MQLWLLQTGIEKEARPEDDALELLTAQDITEGSRLLPGRRRRQFLRGRLLLRRALRTHFSLSHVGWTIERDRHGRPFLLAPESETPVHFSISHTFGLTACLIANRADAALDVERIEENDDLRLVARENFSRLELADLMQHDGWSWFVRFFEYWTLKEAYCKALGLGLRLCLADIEFQLGDTGRIRMQHGRQGTPEPWFFWTRHLTRTHVLSIAARRGLHAAPEVTCWSISPQGGDALRRSWQECESLFEERRPIKESSGAVRC